MPSKVKPQDLEDAAQQEPRDLVSVFTGADWVLFFDDLAHSQGCGAEVVLVSPEREQLLYMWFASTSRLPIIWQSMRPSSSSSQPLCHSAFMSSWSREALNSTSSMSEVIATKKPSSLSSTFMSS
jgi:hypothetical protein